MQKEKRKQSKDEENDSSSRKRRKADLTAMTEPESSRSRPEGAYDVFLSFRGEDTRKAFTDHLYTALVQAGIYTFRDDDELPRGEEISEHLLKAIRESKISIVVFSKGYASSRWCLNELVEILKCKRRKTGLIVLPIFYDIDPSDVRKQNGSFAEAFVKHEERFEEKLVKEWRKALEEAGNVSGWNLIDMANGHEAKFIKDIIKDVWNKLDPIRLYVPEHLVGVDRLARNISNFLGTATDDVRIVGIHGMPGIGKTTTAKVVFNQLCYGFEGSCFLSDINNQPNGLVRLQTQLLRHILKQDVESCECVDRGKVLIKERLCGKRVLVVADDVAHLEQLNALMEERSWFGPGSRVIITTRDSNLLREADQTYQIEELTRDQSHQLFRRHAFKDTKPAEDYIELSKKAVDYCGGLPLALEVIGALLYRKGKERWESEIDNLSRIPESNIQGKLLISFDALDGELQKAFLDIACFFIGIEKEYIAKVLGARCRPNPVVVLETLSERSLIKVVGGMVTMHDLLRDMGREVVFKAFPNHPGKRTRIWKNDEACDVLDQQKGTDDVEGLALDVRASEAKSLSTRSFAKMKRLNLLQINGAHLTGSFKLLSKELIWICWLECPLEFLPSDFTLDNLVVLDMQNNNLRELWKEKKILNRLKILNLSCSKHLIKTPNLHSSSLEKLILKDCWSLAEVHQSVGYLKSLVFLNLEGCSSLKILPESIGNLKSLETLNISECLELETLPNSVSELVSLTALLLKNCTDLRHVPSLEKLTALKRLDLSQTSPYGKIPEGIQCLSNLRYLRMNGCHKIEFPSGILLKLSHLQVFILEEVFDGFYWPVTVKGEEVGCLRELENLVCHFEGQSDFVEYLNFRDKTQSLSTYNIYVGPLDVLDEYLDDYFDDGKSKTVWLVDLCNNGDGDFQVMFPNDIQELYIYKCSCDVSSLIEHSIKLEVINIKDCNSMESLVSSSWFCPSPTPSPSYNHVFSCLEEFNCFGCSSMKKLFPLVLLPNLVNLERIIVTKCGKMEEIIGGTRSDEESSSNNTEFKLPKLSYLKLVDLPELKRICSAKLICDSLQQIEVYDCNSMESLVPSSWICLVNLVSITVDGCKKMEEIIGGTRSDEENGNNNTEFKFSKLSYLHLQNLPELKSICSAKLICDSLEYIYIINCEKLKRMPICFPLLENGQPSPPPSLRYIYIEPKEWWEYVVEWDHPNAKNIIYPFVKFYV